MFTASFLEASKGASILRPSGVYAGFLVLTVALGYIVSALREAEKKQIPRCCGHDATMMGTPMGKAPASTWRPVLGDAWGKSLFWDAAVFKTRQPALEL